MNSDMITNSHDEIGLVVWGIKADHKVFCSNGVVDYNDAVIRDTIKDTRSFIRFNDARLTLYALEFTERYKVFTIYRSCKDAAGRTGAYVAFTLYVPHTKRILNIREVMDLMMDKYFSEYIHPLSSDYLPFKYDDIQPFRVILQSKAEVKDEPRSWKVNRSRQDDRPSIRIINDMNELDEFFSSPYRKEFYSCQEVIFMPSEIYNGQPGSVDFQWEPKLIDTVSPPDPLPRLILENNQEGIEIKSLSVNKEDVADASQGVEVNASDVLHVTFAKSYCDDLEIGGTIESLIETGLLFEKNLQIRFVMPEVAKRFAWKKYTLELRHKLFGSDKAVDVPDKTVKIVFGGTEDAWIEKSRLEFLGKHIGHDCEWYVVPMAGVEPVLGGKIPLKELVDNNAEELSYELSLREWSYAVENRSKKECDFSICIHQPQLNVRGAIGQDQKEIAFKLPQDYQFDIQSDNSKLDVKVTGDKIEISSKPETYRLDLHECDPRKLDWNFECGGKSFRKGIDLIEIPTGYDVQKGILKINGIEFSYNVEKSRIVLTDTIIVIPPEGKSVPVYWNNKCYDISIPTSFPKSKDGSSSIDISGDGYKYVVENKNGVEYYKVSIIGIPVVFEGCEGFAIDGKNILRSNDETRDLISEKVSISSADGRVSCVVYKDECRYNIKAKRRNENNGFRVEYIPDDEKYEIVVRNLNYSKSKYKRKKRDNSNRMTKFFGGLKRGLSKRILLWGVFALFLAAMGTAIWYFISNVNNEKFLLYEVMFLPSREIPEFKDIGIRVKSVSSNNYGIQATDSSVQVLLSKKQIIEMRDNKIDIDDIIVYLKSSGGDTLTNKKFANHIERGLEKCIDYFEDNKSFIERDSFQIILPVQNEYKNLSTDSVNWTLVEQIVAKYNAHKSVFENYCRHLLGKKGYDDKDLNAFKSIFEDMSEESKNFIVKCENENAEKRKIKEAVNKFVEKYRGILGSLNCTKDSVNQVEIAWQKFPYKEGCKSKYDFAIAIEKYKLFFDPEKSKEYPSPKDVVTDLYKKHKEYFSESQRKVLGYYACNSNTFSNIRTTRGMTFDISEKEFKSLKKNEK